MQISLVEYKWLHLVDAMSLVLINFALMSIDDYHILFPIPWLIMAFYRQRFNEATLPEGNEAFAKWFGAMGWSVWAKERERTWPNEPQAYQAHQGTNQGLLGLRWVRLPSFSRAVQRPLFRSVFTGRHHHHHHGRRRRSRLLVASASPPPTHLQCHLRFLPAAAAARHHPRPLRPLPAVAGAGGQPQVPQREGGRGRRGRGRGGAPAAVQLAGVPRGRHGGDQAAAEARGRAGQAQAQGAVGGAEVPPEVRCASICFVDSCGQYSCLGSWDEWCGLSHSVILCCALEF